jgi:Mn2+/Fe2+ NRAMP family transporter
MATSVRDQDQAARPGTRRAATAYRWALLVFVLAVAVQIFLAGVGVFSFGNGDRAGGDHAFSAHQGLGFAIGGAAILILVLAIMARAGKLAVWLAVALVVQTDLLQSLLDGLGGDSAVFGGLHALDGLHIAASAGVQYVRARRR